MRIWFLTPTFPPVCGGSETQVLTLGAGLVRAGHDVGVLTERYPGSAAEEVVRGVRVHRVRTDSREWDAADRVPWEERVFGLLGAAETLIRPGEVDVLQTFCQVGALLGAMMKDGLGCPLVSTMNETTPHTDPFGAARSRLVFAALPHDAVVAGSLAYRDQALGYGADPDRVHVARFGVEEEHFTDADVRAAQAWLGAGDGPVVLLVGRYKARKGQAELVRAMARVARRHPAARAVLVGSLNCASESYRDALVAEIDALGLADRVLLRTSDRPAGSMAALYAAADVVVQPSHAEGLGLSAIEAVMAGVPLIASTIPGLSEVLDSCPGTVGVPAGDVDALAEAIGAVLADPEAAARNAAKARAAARAEFGADGMVERYLVVYQQVRGGAR
ncbi:glycosyltransferase family 4 protein [Saccharopolyspora sp. 5N708]|uniref:glycosyltransferase family 4 protein n=1 Tax=Saccharopolyspora sp. 5N708 TaxID=3457424 RepID=UPI003FD4D819